MFIHYGLFIPRSEDALSFNRTEKCVGEHFSCCKKRAINKEAFATSIDNYYAKSICRLKKDKRKECF